MTALQIAIIALLLSLLAIALLEIAERVSQGTLYILARVDPHDRPQIDVDVWVEGLCWQCVLRQLKLVFYRRLFFFCLGALKTLCLGLCYALVRVGGKGPDHAGGAVGGMEDELIRIEVPGPRLILV